MRETREADAPIGVERQREDSGLGVAGCQRKRRWRRWGLHSSRFPISAHQAPGCGIGSAGRESPRVREWSNPRGAGGVARLGTHSTRFL